MVKTTAKNFDEFANNELTLSKFAWWDWHIPTNKVTINDLKVTWLGYDPKNFQNKGFEAFTSLLHPDDYDRTMDAMKKYLSGEEKIYKIDYRIRDINGNYIWYLDRGFAISSDKNKKPIRLRGIVINMGEFFTEEIKKESIIQLIRNIIPFNNTLHKSYYSICTNCKKLKINEKEYMDFHGKLDEILEVDVSHGLCPECMHTLYPDFDEL